MNGHGNLIRVTFRNGRYAHYTMAIYDLLITDPEVVEILDCGTGEILYYKEEE